MDSDKDPFRAGLALRSKTGSPWPRSHGQSSSTSVAEKDDKKIFLDDRGSLPVKVSRAESKKPRFVKAYTPNTSLSGLLVQYLLCDVC